MKNKILAGLAVVAVLVFGFVVIKNRTKAVSTEATPESAIEKAKVLGEEEAKEEQELTELKNETHVLCDTWRDNCRVLLKKAQQYEPLKNALKYARKEGVLVSTTELNSFVVGGSVHINPDGATPEEITKFLMGSQPERYPGGTSGPN